VDPIETDRLILRNFTLDDAAAFQHLNSDPAVLRYTYDPPIETIEDARRILQEAPLADYARYGYGRVACVLKETGELIGFSGLKYLADYGETDIGYRFVQRCWGQGLATESALPMMAYGRDVLGLERIVGIVDPDNLASARVLRKLGLVYEGTQHVPELDRDMHVYA
jgi:RimJ/RimL family protein N-acetyltransferase